MAVLLMMYLPTLIHAQSNSVSLDEAVELFRQNSLDRMLIAYDQEIKQGNAQNYKAYPNPEIRIFHESLNAGSPEYDETTIQISQPLELLGQPFLRNKSATALSNAAQLEFEYREQILISQLKSLYASYWYLSERLTVVKQALQSVQQARESALARKEEGLYSTTQLQRFNIEYGKYLKMHDEIQVELTQAKNQLMRFLSSEDDGSGDLQFTENFEVVPLAEIEESLVEYALQHRTDVQQAEQMMVATDLQFTVEQRERFPDLNLDFGYKTQSDGSEGFVIGGSVRLPIFNQNKGNIIKARAQAKSRVTELELKRTRIRNEIASAYQKATSLQKQWENVQGFSGNTTLLETAQISYQEGEYSLLELLDATEAYVTGQTLFYQTISEYNQALFMLDVASGGKLFSNQ
tara:strand:+ start:96760 stop:97977 length:1218 start_codon:yes stop_codon:yes gene_type:complete